MQVEVVKLNRVRLKHILVNLLPLQVKMWMLTATTGRCGLHLHHHHSSTTRRGRRRMRTRTQLRWLLRRCLEPLLGTTSVVWVS